MFVRDAPMSRMRPETLLGFADLILEFVFCELVDGVEAHSLSPGPRSALTPSLPYARSISQIVGGTPMVFMTDSSGIPYH